LHWIVKGLHRRKRSAGKSCVEVSQRRRLSAAVMADGPIRSRRSAQFESNVLQSGWPHEQTANAGSETDGKSLRQDPSHGTKKGKSTGDGKSPTDSDEPFLTLKQLAKVVHLSKRTVEKYLKHPDQDLRLPAPDERGRGSKPHFWKLSTLKPWMAAIRTRGAKKEDKGSR